MNVHYGIDANRTNVYQWEYDGSTEQKFRIVYDSSKDAYRLFAMCSSNGNNRVVDVSNQGEKLGAYQNIQIYDTGYDYSQYVTFEEIRPDRYIIRMKESYNYCFTVLNDRNGTAEGRDYDSPGNIYLDLEQCLFAQEWILEPANVPKPSPEGHMERVNDEGVFGWAWRSDRPDDMLEVHIYVKTSEPVKNGE